MKEKLLISVICIANAFSRTKLLDFHVQILLQLCFELLECLLERHPNEIASLVFFLFSFLQLVCVLSVCFYNPFPAVYDESYANQERYPILSP